MEKKGGCEMMSVTNRQSVEDQGEGVVVVGLGTERSGGER